MPALHLQGIILSVYWWYKDVIDAKFEIQITGNNTLALQAKRIIRFNRTGLSYLLHLIVHFIITFLFIFVMAEPCLPLTFMTNLQLSTSCNYFMNSSATLSICQAIYLPISPWSSSISSTHLPPVSPSPLTPSPLCSCLTGPTVADANLNAWWLA